jgi:hypothetical protein
MLGVLLCLTTREAAAEWGADGSLAERIRSSTSARPVVLITQNRPAERAVRRLLRDTEDPEVFIQAGSPSESLAVLAATGRDCGLFLGRSRIRGQRGWDVHEVGPCSGTTEQRNEPIASTEAAPADLQSRERQDDRSRYGNARNVAVASTTVGGALFAAGIGWAATYEVQCAQSECHTPGFGLAAIVFGAWGTIVPMTVAGVELERMNKMRRDNGVVPMTSARLVLPSTGLTLAAFSLYPLGGPPIAVAALLQVSGASFALVNAITAIVGSDHPFAEEKRVAPARAGG